MTSCSSKDVVVAVPTNFGDQQRTDLKNSVKMAGFNVMRVINGKNSPKKKPGEKNEEFASFTNKFKI